MRRRWRATFAGGALVVLSIAHSLSARGSDLERHNELVKTFVIEGGAYPLVADCAAHADFVMRTLPAFGGVEFPASAFDSEHSSVIPSWNERFDGSKQQVKVDTIVSVVGLAIRSSRTATPQALKFRCGYEDGGGDGMFMLAFSWSKSPLPPDWRKSRDDGIDQPEMMQVRPVTSLSTSVTNKTRHALAPCITKGSSPRAGCKDCPIQLFQRGKK